MKWEDDAVCQSVGPYLFFGLHQAKGGGDDRTRVQHARKMCASCPVWRQCRFAGLAEADGLWGGMTPRERMDARAAAGVTVTHSGGTLDTEAVVKDMRATLRRCGEDVDVALRRYPGAAQLFLDFNHRVIVRKAG